MQQHQLQARDLMDRRLEHFLLPVGLPEKRCSERAGFWTVFECATVGLKPEQLLGWDVYLQPFSEIHRNRAVAQ